MHNATDASEYPGHESVERLLQGRHRGRDHGHRLPDQGRRVWHDAYDGTWFGGVGVGFSKHALDLGDGHAGQDADEEFPAQGVRNAGFGQDCAEELRLTGEKDDGGGASAAEIVPEEDLKGGIERREGVFDFFGGFGPCHTGYEAIRHSERGRGRGRRYRLGCAVFVEGKQYAGEDGNAQGALEDLVSV